MLNKILDSCPVLGDPHDPRVHTIEDSQYRPNDRIDVVQHA